MSTTNHIKTEAHLPVKQLSFKAFDQLAPAVVIGQFSNNQM